ncbi:MULTISPECIES: DUF2057 family protein [Vibrio]|uniref:DUF2057 family protein n=1 Tax=Vibrio TaxID=662 RepID=UPI00018F35B1|nr:DUF2057 family protein [Vibrio sp. 16]EED28656.1 conserved hypothetical protein [Vibrio sp. 16]CAK4075073.1 hypothetical protein VDT1_3776 [Vibrio sp. 16]
MKVQTSLLAFAALGLSTNALADVTISIPDTVEVLLVNEQKPQLDGGLFSSQKTVTLPDGENQILFLYKPYFTQGKDRIIVESDPIVAKFAAKESELVFDFPSYRNVREAKAEIKSAEWQFKNQNGQVVAVQQEQLAKEGMQIGRNFKLEIAEYNRHDGIASLNKSIPIPTNVSMDDLKGENTAEQMLHFWYQEADKETQQRFKQFLLAQ